MTTAEATLRIAPQLALPLDAVTSTFGIFGIRGSGKTTGAAVITEEILDNGVPCCVIDPTGAHWGLRSSADGKKAGFPVVIFGGRHADVPLEPGSGETVARLVVEQPIPAVFDLSLMRKGAMRDWVTTFLETLYRLNREPLHVVIDEAHLFAPQRAAHGSERCLGAVEDVVLLGRLRGLGVTLVCQRIANLNKSVLTQVETLVLLRTVGRPDIAAIDDWVANHADPEQAREVKASLPSLPTGQGWVWSPSFLNVLVRVNIRKRRTFDSSATPKVGQVRVEPQKWAAIDIAALGEQVRAAIEQAKQTDPKALHARIASLEREALAAERATAALTRRFDAEKERAVAAESRIRELTEALASSSPEPVEPGPAADPAYVANTRSVLQRIVDLATDATGLLASAQPAPAGAPRPTPVAPAAPAAKPPAATTAARPTLPAAPGTAPRLGKAHRAVLSALAPYAPGARSKRQVALLSGYASNGGGFGNAISALRTAGFIEGPGSALVATDTGLDALGPYDPLPTGSALRAHWQAQSTVGRAGRLILDALADAYPAALTKAELAEATGYEPNGGGFGNAISRLRTLELISGPGAALRLSDELAD